MSSDRLHLEHIGNCIARVEEYVADGREAFMSSQLIQDAVVRNLQTLAESTRRISQQLKTDHPSIDWRMIGVTFLASVTWWSTTTSVLTQIRFGKLWCTTCQS